MSRGASDREERRAFDECTHVIGRTMLKQKFGNKFYYNIGIAYTLAEARNKVAACHQAGFGARMQKIHQRSVPGGQDYHVWVRRIGA